MNERLTDWKCRLTGGHDWSEPRLEWDGRIESKRCSRCRMKHATRRPTAQAALDKIKAECKEHPGEMRVRVAINGGDWRLMKGDEFLGLWEQAAFAGTIDIGLAYRLPGG